MFNIGECWIWQIKLFGKLYLFTYVKGIRRYFVYRISIDNNFEVDKVRDFDSEHECVIFIDSLSRGYVCGEKIKSWRQIYGK